MKLKKLLNEQNSVDIANGLSVEIDTGVVYIRQKSGSGPDDVIMLTKISARKLAEYLIKQL